MYLGIGLRLGGQGGESGSAPTPFDPATLFASSERGFWYDISDLDTLFTTHDGAVNAVVGNAVGRVEDKSGNDYHAIMSSAPNRPILRQDVGGAYYLDFDGSNDFLVTPTIDFSTSLSQKITVSVAMDMSGQAGTGVIYECGRAGTQANMSSLVKTSTYSEARWTNNNPAQGVRRRNTTAAGLETLTVLMDRDAAGIADAITMTLNGSEATLTTQESVIATTQSFVSYPMNIGRYYNLNAGFLNGKLYGMILRNATSTADQLTGTDAYMAGLAGL